MSEWNAILYDNKHDFVAEYGKGLLEFVPKNEKQSILDLGCGTGTLTAQLRNLAKIVIGVDSSRSMIKRAQEQYSDIDIQFMVCDALALPFEKQFDVIFSNAVFHWIADHNTLLYNVRRALKSNGCLVCEFGASGNIATIENAFMKVCKEFGHEYHPKFNFPTTEHFSDLLKKNGFVIDKIYDYDRPTPLKDGKRGLANWMKQFFASDLECLSEKKQDEIIKKVEDITKELLWNGKEWMADYRRLRVIAYIDNTVSLD